MVVDVLIVIFAILFSIRRLEARRREAEQFPRVPVDVFERYKTTALRVNNLGAGICFGKLVLDYSFQYFAKVYQLPWNLVRGVGASIFFGWLALFLWTLVLNRRNKRFAEENGIDLRTPIPERSP